MSFRDLIENKIDEAIDDFFAEDIDAELLERIAEMTDDEFESFSEFCVEAQLDELSPELLKRYRDKAVKQFKQSNRKRNDPGYTDAKRKEHDKRALKRFRGSQSASQKIKDRGGYKALPAGVKEEVQPIDDENVL